MLWKEKELEKNIVSVLCTYGKSVYLNHALDKLYDEFTGYGKRFIDDVKNKKIRFSRLEILKYNLEKHKVESEYIENGFKADIGEARKFSCCLEYLKSGGKIKEHVHPKGIQIELVIDNDVVYNGGVYWGGRILISGPNFPHYFVNPFKKDVNLLSISIPPWTPENEILI